MTVASPPNSMFYQILLEIQRGLREDIRFDPQPNGTAPAISPSAIVIRKLVPSKPGFPAMTEEEKPGWLITPAMRVRRPAQAGENSVDITFYGVLCQLIAADHEKSDLNLATYLWWQEQCARYLNHRFASYRISNGKRCIRDNVCQETLVVDRKMYVQHQQFVAGVECLCEVGEERGTYQ